MARTSSQPPSFEENSDGFFAAFTDLLVGLIFLLMIIIMSFGLEFKDKEKDYERTTDEVLRMEYARGDLLRVISDRMRERGYTVIIDFENGIIRLHEELLFDSAQWNVSDQGKQALSALAEVFAEVLPCAVFDHKAKEPECEGIPRTNYLESILVEGHTDKEAFNSETMTNWELSAFRAISVYRALVDAQPMLETSIHNRKDEPVLGVSAYAERRPVDDFNLEPNRRIDVRFNLHAPTLPDVVEVY